MCVWCVVCVVCVVERDRQRNICVLCVCVWCVCVVFVIERGRKRNICVCVCMVCGEWEWRDSVPKA
jgi:hypothetical protein